MSETLLNDAADHAGPSDVRIQASCPNIRR